MLASKKLLSSEDLHTFKRKIRRIITIRLRRSFQKKIGEKLVMRNPLFNIPFFLWRLRTCIITKARIKKGKIKWRLKKNFSVVTWTIIPPQIQNTKLVPITGSTEKNLVITVTAQ